jgi:hypothetical protein
MTWRVRYWTGPTRVRHYAERIRVQCSDFRDVWEGTEHVYFTCDSTDEWATRRLIEDTLGKSFVRVESL